MAYGAWLNILLQSAFTSMCCHMYNWNIVECNIKQPIHPTNQAKHHQSLYIVSYITPTVILQFGVQLYRNIPKSCMWVIKAQHYHVSVLQLPPDCQCHLLQFGLVALDIIHLDKHLTTTGHYKYYYIVYSYNCAYWWSTVKWPEIVKPYSMDMSINFSKNQFDKIFPLGLFKVISLLADFILTLTLKFKRKPVSFPRP